MVKKSPDLHGNAPDNARLALLLIDVINDLEFKGGDKLLRQALPAARKIATLKRRAAQTGIPSIYVNDNFGKWRSDFKKLISHCLDDKTRGRPIYHLFIPSDCVVSQDRSENRRVLKFMQRVYAASSRSRYSAFK